jgi:hypothetical protein
MPLLFLSQAYLTFALYLRVVDGINKEFFKGFGVFEENHGNVIIRVNVLPRLKDEILNSQHNQPTSVYTPSYGAPPPTGYGTPQVGYGQQYQPQYLQQGQGQQYPPQYPPHQQGQYPPQQCPPQSQQGQYPPQEPPVFSSQVSLHCFLFSRCHWITFCRHSMLRLKFRSFLTVNVVAMRKRMTPNSKPLSFFLPGKKMSV